MNEKFWKYDERLKEVLNENRYPVAEEVLEPEYGHLISAAPEMYESNETTLRELENIVSGLDRACVHCDRYLMRGKKACRNCAAEKARKTAQEMKDRISGLQQKARGEPEE